MPGLGTSFGRSAANTFQQDLQNSDCILIEGSNFAECHPIGFRWVMAANERGATIIHVDPHFSRTSQMADIYAPIRAGTDIAFLGGLINYVLQNELYFKEYVQAYTNAQAIVSDDFQDTEDLEGVFSGLDTDHHLYDTTSWQYKLTEAEQEAQAREAKEQGQSGKSEQAALRKAQEAGVSNEQHIMPDAQEGQGTIPHAHPRQIQRDPTLQHPRCVFQILKRHYARYTPELVEQICGIPQDLFFKIAAVLVKNSGRERTMNITYSVGWTQHTIGVQMIRTAGILQLLLGNMGRPGGCILALRGHANIQGSTDIPTLYNLLPGYLAMPNAQRKEFDLQTYWANNNESAGWWVHYPEYFISLMKVWYGDAATKENDWAFNYLPKVVGDYSDLPMFVSMKDGHMKGFFLLGQNPAGGVNAGFHRAALEKLDWLMVRDLYPIESAIYWKRPGIDPTKIGTEVFFLPAASHVEKEGSFTNTQRLIQWREKAIEPPDDARSDNWFMTELYERVKALYKNSTKERDKPILDLTWNYLRADPLREPVVDDIVKEINGYTLADGKVVKDFTALKGDGSTACGCWIFSGIMPEGGDNRSKHRNPDNYVSLDWGFAWPANRRILYNRASADPQGRPWSERKKYIWWDPEHQNSDLYPKTPNNPVVKYWNRPDNPKHGIANPAYPYAITTYRLTEHHVGGAMSRWILWLSELQPELFAEISRELAAEKGVKMGDWITINTARGEIEAKAMVTDRIQSLKIEGRIVHQNCRNSGGADHGPERIFYRYHALYRLQSLRSGMQAAEMITTTTELGLIVALIPILGPLARPLFKGKTGLLFTIGTIGSGLLSPLLLKLGWRMNKKAPPRSLTISASLLTLIGGVILRAVWILAGRISTDNPRDTHYYNALEWSNRITRRNPS